MPESVELVELDTGARVERHAVDARECVASGSYVMADAYVPAADSAPVAAPSVGGEGEGGAPSTAESTTSESEGSSEDASESEAKPTRRKAQG